MYERILIPLDGSTAAEKAIPYAEEIAASAGSLVALVGVSDAEVAGTERLYESYLRQIADQVRAQLRDWKPPKAVEVQTRVLAGTAPTEILSYANEINAGLIVMTNRGSSTPGPWPLGHIVGKVVRATERPLLLVRAAPAQAALEQRKLVCRILAPLDGSTLGAAAVPYAEKMADALDAELVLLQVVEPMTNWASYIGGTVPYYEPPEDIEKAKGLALQYLESVAAPLRGKGLKVSTAVVMGTPAEQIVDYAATNSIDIVAMSTHGRTGISRWVFGNVTDKVLHAGDTGVLVVRPSRTQPAGSSGSDKATR